MPPPRPCPCSDPLAHRPCRLLIRRRRDSRPLAVHGPSMMSRLDDPGRGVGGVVRMVAALCGDGD